MRKRVRQIVDRNNRNTQVAAQEIKARIEARAQAKAKSKTRRRGCGCRGKRK